MVLCRHDLTGHDIDPRLDPVDGEVAVCGRDMVTVPATGGGWIFMIRPSGVVTSIGPARTAVKAIRCDGSTKMP